MPADDGDLDRCRIRLIGIQAPEKAGAAGGSAADQCRSASATAALAATLPVGTRVQLRSISVRSVEDDYSGGRLARSVYYEDGSGAWVDAGRAVMASGHAMWFPHGTGDEEKPEYSHNLEYRRLVDAAAAARRGLWSPDYCGPSTPRAVRTWIVSDPIGSDSGREYVVVQNTGTAPLDISGWTVRDSSLTTFTVPPGTTLAPGGHIRVHSGSGTAGSPLPGDYYFGGPSAMFSNWLPSDGYFHGDGAYVYDVQPGYAYGNLQSWFHYPCDPASCDDPLVGRVAFGEVVYDPSGADTAAGEYVEIRNLTASPLSLAGYAFERRGSQYAFPPSTTLAGGASLRLSMGTGTDTPSLLHLGRTASLLANSGDLVMLARMDHAPVDCRAWGGFTCAGLPASGPPPGPAAPPAPPPTAQEPPTTVVSAPGAPTNVRVRQRGRRLVVRWTGPETQASLAASAEITKYRARVLHRTKKKKLKKRATCTATAAATKCRTKKLKKRRTYVIKVQARNAAGYGPTARTRIRMK
jgi:endonuclease YncB( thermonuclease family)